MATDSFDPYRKWLGIPPAEQPPTHYRLLAIAEFEEDMDVISNAADRAMAHVRTFKSGPNAAMSQQILNELSDARVTLLDNTKKSAYDAELRGKRRAAASAASNVAPAGDPSGSLEPRPPTAAPPLRDTSPRPVGAAPPPEPVIGGPLLGRPAGSSTPRPRPPRVKKDNSAPLIIAGVGIVLILGIGLAFVSLSDDDKPSTTYSPPAPPSVHRTTPTPNTGTGSTSDGKGVVNPGSGDKRPDSGLNNPIATPDVDPISTDGVKEDPAKKAIAETALRETEALLRADINLREFGDKILRADRLVHTQDQLLRLQRLRTVETLLKTFDENIRSAANALQPGDKIEMHGNEGESVEYVKSEGAPLKLVVRDGDNETTYIGNEIPTPIAMSLANLALPLEPNDKAAMAAYLVLRNDGDKGEVSTLWAEGRSEITDADAVASLLRIDRGVAGSSKKSPKSGTSDEPIAPLDIGPAPSATAKDGRLIVPDANALRDANRRVREQFRDAIRNAKNADAKTALAKQFFAASRAVKEPAMKYALLDEAVDIAVDLGSARAASLMIDEMAEVFAVEALELKSIELKKVSSAIVHGPLNQELYEIVMELFNEAKVSQRYDLALRFVEIASASAGKAKQFEMVANLKREVETTGYLADEYTAARSARQTLAKTADDPAAMTALGRYECFVEGKWERGLEKLAKGSDQELAAAAKIDLSNPSDAETQAKLGEDWYALGKRRKGAALPALTRRAQLWFQKAQSTAQGDTATRVAGRLAEIEVSLTSSP